MTLPDILNAGKAHRLALVVVSGKTEIDALRTRWMPAGGVGGFPEARYVVVLTAEHNDPARFFEALACGLEPLIGPLSLDGVSPDAGIVELLNAVVTALPVDTPGAVLVLWGYEAIELPDIHEALALMLDYLPPGLRVVVVTTRIPPLANIPRLRARRQLLELSV